MTQVKRMNTDFFLLLCSKNQIYIVLIEKYRIETNPE